MSGSPNTLIDQLVADAVEETRKKNSKFKGVAPLSLPTSERLNRVLLRTMESEGVDPERFSRAVETQEMRRGALSAFRTRRTKALKKLTPALLAAIARAKSAAAGPTCLVLSGGAAKGSFEVGALCLLKKANLLDDLKIDCVVGTSVGAVNAAALGGWGFKQGIPRLTDMWLGLEKDKDMYMESAEVAAARVLLMTQGIDLDIEDLPAMMQGSGAPLQALGLQDEVHRATAGFGMMAGSALVGGVVGVMATAVGAGLVVNSVGSAQSTIGIVLNAFRIVLEGRGLRDFAPLRKLMKDAFAAHPPKWGGNGHPKIRLCAVSVGDGDGYFTTETGKLLRNSAKEAKASEVWQLPGSADDRIVDGVIASSTVPLFFPAQPLMDKRAKTKRWFVDGGLREVLPLQGALDLEYRQVIGVLAGRRGMDAKRYAKSPSAAQAAVASLGIMLDEITENDIHLQQHFANSTVIFGDESTFEDSFSVDPGLIRIGMDYGYMRAFDMMLADIADKVGEPPLSSSEQVVLQTLADLIQQERLKCWKLEQGLIGMNGGFPYYKQATLDLVRSSKKQTLTLVESRVALFATRPKLQALCLPFDKGVRAWWDRLERHASDSWLAIVTEKGAHPYGDSFDGTYVWQSHPTTPGPIYLPPSWEPTYPDAPSVSAELSALLP